jgi:nicotinate-nucleotide pyrophosphorylase (carboxylating)
MIVMTARERDAAQRLIEWAFREDRADEDVTSLSLIDPSRKVRAVLLTRQACTVSGLEAAALAIRTLDPEAVIGFKRRDGERAASGDELLELTARAAPLLTAERTALNLAQRMSGVATLTARFVDAVRPHRTAILDTRKTPPGWRVLDKYAVRCGGGVNHRFDLRERAIVKDNHRAFWRSGVGATLADAVNAVRARFPGVSVEVEVETLEQLNDALRAAPEWIMLDNMTPDLMREAVRLCAGRCLTEASGGIRLETVAEAASTGVDAISLGCLTHSPPAVDLSLEIVSP